MSDAPTIVLDAHAALSCPLATFNAWSPGVDRPDQPARLPMPGSAAFRERVVAALLGSAGTVVDLRRLPDDACLDAMAARADVIIGGSLPSDPETHRRGRVPLLVRDPAGYRPAIIRYHRLLQAGATLPYSRLDAPSVPLTRSGVAYRWQSRLDNALQLAHYWRMLDALGQASPDRWGGVVGLDEVDGRPVIAWVPLDATDEPNALALYDAEFAECVQVAERAVAGEPADLEPLVTRECSWCRWWPACRPRLHEDDLGLRLPNSHLNRAELLGLRAAGVRSVTDLAGADLDRLLDRLPLASQRPGFDERLATAQRRARLTLAGVELERATTEAIDVPAAPLEIDIDLETSRDDRVYLWGFWVSDADTGESGYRSFAAFEHLDDAGEFELARTALTWLRERVAGADALVYHYSEYETVRIARLAQASGDPAIEWADRWARSGFVDLFPIVQRHFFGTNGLSLKVVAHAGAGFSWRDADPGGLNSMAWFEDAVGGDTEEIRARARTRVLEYNEDDVRATVALRRWLGESGPGSDRVPG